MRVSWRSIRHRLEGPASGNGRVFRGIANDAQIKYQGALILTHKKEIAQAVRRATGRIAGKPRAMRGIHPPQRQRRPLWRTGRRGLPTPAPIRPAAGSPARPERRFPKAFGRPNAFGRGEGLAMPASPRHALLAKNLGKPSLWVIINARWYYTNERMNGHT